jgi:ABC-type multidrug transport system ATPase subunit
MGSVAILSPDGCDSGAGRTGEIFGILGSNGAGKTTLVACIAARRRTD